MGALSGVRIIELAAIGPAPFAAMMLADHGAEVIRVDRADGARGGVLTDPAKDVLMRSRRSIALDLKKPEGIAVLRDLTRNSDGFMEGFRPGVMERLGLGPEVLLADNPKLVYGRMTGWGQTGPYAPWAGHDINYIALSGNLHTYGLRGGKPVPPANAVGDFAGGGMMLAFGMVAGILAVRGGAPGQVIDCAMSHGAAVIAAMTWSLFGQGRWTDKRGDNLLDTGSHFYNTYETADGKWIAIAASEPRFYAELRRLTGLDADHAFDAQLDKTQWPALQEKLAALFKTKTRDEWCKLMEMTDACFAPVLSLAEAPHHPHNIAHGVFAEIDGLMQPMPAPVFSGSPAPKPRSPRPVGADTGAILQEIGYSAEKIAALKEAGIFGRT
jgi:alpha-methylacyl-CoA racemase